MAVADISEISEIWQAILGDLQLQMTKGTFETQLHGSRPVSWDGATLVVGVPNRYAVEWLENRLHAVVMRAVRRHLPAVGQLRFVVARGQAPPGDAAKRKEQDVKQDVEIATVTLPELVEFERQAQERLRGQGFSQLTNYALLFWTRLLGPTPFLVWATANAVGWREQHDKRRFSRPVKFSVTRLARIAANGRPQAIRGVWRKCKHQRQAGVCCGLRGDRLTVMDDRGICRYWQPGAFDVLKEERIGAVDVWRDGGWTPWQPYDPEVGIGRALQRQRYRLVVFRPLPLLTPEQVGRLDAVSQDEHDSWLTAAGVDSAEWERLTVRSLGLGVLA